MTQTHKINLINLRRHNEVAFGEPANFVGVDLHAHFPPGQAQIRMVPFLFGHRAHLVHEVEPRLEIGKRKALSQVMLLDDFPIRQLFGVWKQIGALERRHASAAWHAMPFSQVAHSTSRRIVLFSRFGIQRELNFLLGRYEHIVRVERAAGHGAVSFRFSVEPLFTLYGV
jgi:hypothetical protein